MKMNRNSIEEAKKLWKNGHHEQAIHILEVENELKQDNQVIVTLVHFYVEDGFYKEALRLVNDQNEELIYAEDFFETYVKILIENDRFILARKELLNHKTLDAFNRDGLVKALDKKEEYFKKNYPQTIVEEERNFYHIGDQKFIKQSKILDDATKLPLENYAKIAKYNLVDPFLNQVTRVSILKELAFLKVKETVDFQWIDGIRYKVKPIELTNQVDLKIEIDALVRKNNDPIQAEMLVQQVNLMYDLACPFPKRIFETASEWEQGIRKQILEQTDVKKFDQLNQIMKSIIEQ